MKKIGILMLMVFVLSLLSVGVVNADISLCRATVPENEFFECAPVPPGADSCKCASSVVAKSDISLIRGEACDAKRFLENGVPIAEVKCKDGFFFVLGSLKCPGDKDSTGDNRILEIKCTDDTAEIPEFSTFGIIAAIAAIGLGTAFVMRRRKK